MAPLRPLPTETGLMPASRNQRRAEDLWQSSALAMLTRLTSRSSSGVSSVPRPAPVPRPSGGRSLAVRIVRRPFSVAVSLDAVVVCPSFRRRPAVESCHSAPWPTYAYLRPQRHPCKGSPGEQKPREPASVFLGSPLSPGAIRRDLRFAWSDSFRVHPARRRLQQELMPQENRGRLAPEFMVIRRRRIAPRPACRLHLPAARAAGTPTRP